MVHHIAAVGSRTVAKAQDFINKIAGGNKDIKAYGTYEEVFADKVQYSAVVLQVTFVNRCARMSMVYT